ncbi:MAG: hypothetical protein VB071_02150 [Lawsonibacter sp.]|nr:hypothetical protein [Lawsonibacter sp.]
MSELRKIFVVAMYDFRRWRRNPRIIITFALAFILCYMLSDKAVRFAADNKTTMQFLEAFIWTFGDADSIMLSSALLLLLFADMPFITTATPFFLMRIIRKTFLLGQGLYIVLTTLCYIFFVLLSTTVICMNNSFFGNIWSETAALLGYSGAGADIALPSFVKVMTLSRPYTCTLHIFLLMLLYALVLAFVMLLGNLRKGPAAGVGAAFVFTLAGFLLKPDLLQKLFKLSDALQYKANVVVGWLSPLNQATYYMHNFGYDLLPRLWQTYAIFSGLILLLFWLSLHSIRSYSFNFTGTEG